MADPLTTPDSDNDIGDDTSGTPSWVKVFGIVIIVLMLLFIVLHLAGGGLGSHTR